MEYNFPYFVPTCIHLPVMDLPRIKHFRDEDEQFFMVLIYNVV